MALLDFMKLGNLGELINNPLAVARMAVKIAPVATHTVARKRFYDEICAASALLARNTHILLGRAMVEKRDLTAEEVNQLVQIEADMLLCAHRLNIHRKLIPSEFTLERLADAYGITTTPQAVTTSGGSGEAGQETRDQGGARDRDESSGAAS